MTTREPKRIVRLVARLNISGPALQAILLTSEFQKLNYDCVLISSVDDDSGDTLLDVAKAHHVEPLIIPQLAYTRPFGSVRAVWRLTEVLRELQPDIIHTHNTRAGFLGRIAARLAGVPVVVHTLHEYPFDGYYNRPSTIIFIYMERLGAYLSDSIITLSQSLRETLASRYGVTRKSRITVLPLGYDLKSFAGTPRHQGTFRQQWQIADDAPLIGIIGRLLAVKNHRLFLDMAAGVIKQHPDARFVIIGDGDERAELETYAANNGLEQHVIFTGWQQHLEAIYSDLDVLVNSSLNEGTPVPIIEALAAQCPVVATDVGGVVDLLDNGAYGALVPSGNRDKLVAAVLETLAHPPDMTAARKTMLRRYGIERLAQDLDSLYRGLFARHPD